MLVSCLTENDQPLGPITVPGGEDTFFVSFHERLVNLNEKLTGYTLTNLAPELVTVSEDEINTITLIDVEVRKFVPPGEAIIFKVAAKPVAVNTAKARIHIDYETNFGNSDEIVIVVLLRDNLVKLPGLRT
jgi:hypothetical protein